MRGIVVCFLIAAVAISAWWFGGYQVQTQFVAYSITLLAGALWLIESATGRAASREFVLPALGIPFAAVLLIGAWHLSATDEPLVQNMAHAEFEQLRPVVSEDVANIRSLYPPATRLRLAAFSIAFLALLSCSEPIRSRLLLRVLLGAIAVNGMCLAVYGILRRIQASDMIYDSLSAQAGFSSFINRNQASAFLNMSIAAGVGWLMLLGGERPARAELGERPIVIPRFSLARFLSGLTGEQLLAALCVLVMCAGVLFSLSRGGIASLVLAATAASLYSTRRFGIAVTCVALTAGIAVSLAVYLGEWSTVQSRLQSLAEPAASWKGRFDHWQDTFGAVRDFPVTGTGWGTYAFANLPYQQHLVELWYVNADNLYFESLVEGGVLGLIAFLLMWLILLFAVLRLFNKSAGREARALASMGLMVWIAQSVQSATDFGLLRPPNGLLFGVLMGLIIGEAVHSIRLPPAGRWLALSRLPGWSRVVIATVFVGVAGLGVVEYARAAMCASAVDAVPPLDGVSPAIDSVQDVDHYIASIEDALSNRPDDSETHLKLAELWVHRYRLSALAEMTKDPELVEGISPSTLWRLSHPSSLQRIYMIHFEAYGLEGGAEIRNVSHVRDNLEKAAAHLRLARHVCPVSRQIDYLASTIALVSSDDPAGRKSLARSLFAAPARRSRLIDLGQLALNAFQYDLAIASVRQALDLSSDEVMRAWTMFRERMSDTEIIERVLLQRPELLLDLLDSLPAEDPARELLIARLQELKSDQTFDTRSEGRLAQAVGDYADAIRAYKVILAEHPGDLRIRVRVIRCYMEQGDYKGAVEQLARGLRQAPESPDLLNLKEELLQRQREE